MTHIHPENLIIIDIETAPGHLSFEHLPDEWKMLWQEKIQRQVPEGITAESFYPDRAGVMAEFGKIICISIAYFYKESELGMRVKSFYGHDEKKILSDFSATIEKIALHNNNWCFAGHNIREFDIPFICRRMLINHMSLPGWLDFQNKKPWETNIVDSFQFWRFGDYKNYTSLKLLAAALGIPSPKDDIDGSMVGALYWEEDESLRESNLKRIAHYCQKDVVTTGNIILRFKNMQTVPPENIRIVE